MPVKTLTNLGPRNVYVKSVDYPKTSIEGIYPFRVKFKNINISFPASQGIGIAVIGTSFVIL